MVYATPEEAARADLAEHGFRHVELIGVVIRGDEAVVAHVVHPPPRSDFDTAKCRRVDGGWVGSSLGNTQVALIFTRTDADSELITVVSWHPAPHGAIAARWRFLGREQVFPVERGHVVVAFDDIPFPEYWPDTGTFPPEEPYGVEEWIFPE